MGKHEVIDLRKAFGRRDYQLTGVQYREQLARHPLVENLWTIGRYFVLVANTQTWTCELATGDCEEISGYSADEIQRGHAEFMMNFGLPEDMGFNLGVVRLGMDYLLSRPEAEREWIYVVYFYRARRKDGRIIAVQQQSIPLYYDPQKIPFIFSNIFTDITFLGVRNLPQALLVNRSTREVFNVDNGHMKLTRAADLFSARERDIVHLLIKGLNSGQIAGQLHISAETVRTHRKNILRKAGLRNTQELIGFALTRGMT